MASTRKEIRIIADFIRPYGYQIVTQHGHNKIIDANGRFLISFSGTPSRPHWYKNVIRDLIRYHHCN